ncbi:MAG TPA: hypothetical protein VGC87_04310 [Pyrinomonadaceae bacterium]|jgi:uncharacterized protein (TIGR03437 family)
MTTSLVLKGQTLLSLPAKLRSALISVAALLLLFGAAGLTARAATITVPAGGDLQSAINAASLGDTIILEAGATYVGPFTLPYKGEGTGTDADYITIESSALASLPAGVRVTPAQAQLMARLIVGNYSGMSRGPAVVATQAHAHHYKLLGLEITSEPTASIPDLLALGDGSEAQDTLAEVPHHFIVDRCLIRASEHQAAKRGVALNSAETVISNSYLAGFKLVGEDAQAVAMWNGPGPYLIENNYLEAAGENVLILGASNWIPNLIPSDVTIRRNHVAKPLSWYPKDASYAGTPWTVKNLLEFKTGKRVLIEGNLIEYVWQSGQDGNAIVIAPIVNGQGSTPQLEDITIRSNIVRHASSAVSLDGKWAEGDSSYLRRVQIANNLFEDIDARWGDNYGRLFIVNDHSDQVTIEHNTALNSNTAVFSNAGGNTNFVSRNNIFRKDVGSGLNPGDVTLSTYFPEAAWAKNAQIAGESAYYTSHPNNYFPADETEVGFVNRAAGNYHLADASPYKGQATDGHDIGCDFDALEKAMTSSSPGTDPTTPSSPALVTDAHDAALALANSSNYSATETAQLAAGIQQAYTTFQAESARFASAEQIDVNLRAAYYFTRAATALINAGAPAASVQDRLQIAELRLAQAASLMQQQTNASLAHALSATAMPVIGPADIRSAGSLGPNVSPGSLGLVFGDTAISPLAPETAAAAQAADGSFPYELSGVSVTVGGFAAQVIAVSPSQVNFYVPAGVPSGAAELLVTSKDGKVSRGTTVIPAVAPAIFTKGGTGAGAAVAFNTATYLAGNFDVTTEANFGADKRTRLTLFTTGIGAGVVNKNLTNDILGPAGTILNLSESVKVEARTQGGVTLALMVEYAGRQNTLPGLDQVVVILPSELKGAGDVELTLVAGGQRSNVATVFVK